MYYHTCQLMTINRFKNLEGKIISRSRIFIANCVSQSNVFLDALNIVLHMQKQRSICNSEFLDLLAATYLFSSYHRFILHIFYANSFSHFSYMLIIYNIRSRFYHLRSQQDSRIHTKNKPSVFLLCILICIDLERCYGALVG